MATTGFKVHVCFRVLGLFSFATAVDIATDISQGDESCALQVRAAASVLARNEDCPTERPDFGAACSVSPGVNCEYDPITCPGNDEPIFTTMASCSESGEWSVRMARIMCPQVTASCPESRPPVGEQCTVDPEATCNYNFVTCPGATEETPTAFARCLAGNWQIIMASVCAPSACPESMPAVAEECDIDPEVTCNYNFVMCPGAIEETPTAFAKCRAGSWAILMPTACAAQPTPAPTLAPTPTTTLTAQCVDIDQNHCDLYREEGFCDTSENVMRDCAKTCGLCPGVCEDLEKNHCDGYRIGGYCQTSPSVQRECKQTCGFCRSNCGAAEPTYCGFYEAEGKCDTDPGVERECKNTCGFCP